MNVKIIAALLVLVPASMACGFSIHLPEMSKAGPEIEESITVADPKHALSGAEVSVETRLNISFSAGELTVSPGLQGENLVDGTAIYNVADLKPEIKKSGNSIELKQGDFNGLPPFNDMKNKWDLKLSDAPMELIIQAGAYEGNLELGGLALKNLAVRDGAAVNINHGSGWAHNGQKYVQKSSGATLTIIVQMAAGNLIITD